MSNFRLKSWKGLVIVIAVLLSIIAVTLMGGVKTNLQVLDVDNIIGQTSQMDEPSNAVTSSWYNYRNQSGITGNGTANSPWTIRTPNNLAYIANMISNDNSQYVNGHYKLMNDLDMDGYYWIPIENFAGVFDGNYKTIKNLILNDSSTTNSGGFGLFEQVSGGTIKNLGVKINYDFSMVAGLGSYAGGLVGMVSASSDVSIERCWVSGNMVVETEKPDAYVASLIGYVTSSGVASNMTITIKDCFSDAEISVFSVGSNIYAGGLFGHFSSATAINNYFTCPVNVTNVLFLGDINVYRNTKTPVISGIVAELAEEPKNTVTHSITNSYYNRTTLDEHSAVESQPDSNFTNVAGLSETQLEQDSNLVGFDFDTVWEREPISAIDPDKQRLPRLAGFNYPEVEYVTLTFILEGETYGIRYVQKNTAFYDFPVLPDRGDGTIGGWSSTDIYGNYYDFNNCSYSTSFLGHYLDPVQAIKVTYVAYKTVGGVPSQSQIIDSIYIQKGSNALKIPAPSINGYTFEDWYSDANLTSKYDWNKTLNGNITIYAKYTPSKYTINIYDGTTLIESRPVDHGQKLGVFNPPVKDGYTFDALYWNDKFTGSPFSMNTGITYSFNLYAKYDPNPLTVTFHYEGTDPDTKIWGELQTVVNLYYDETIESDKYPVLETKVGYDKVAPVWMFGDIVWDPETKVQDNIDLYAEYTINTYTITFQYPEILREIITSSGGSMIIKQVTVEHGDTVIPPSDTEVGNFAGYKRSNPKWDVQYFVNITSDMEVTALFELASLKVVFIANGQEFSFDVEPGKAFEDELPIPPYRYGYDQIAPYWDLSKVDLTNITTNLEIHAVYTINQYDVVYKMPDGTSTTIKVNHGGTVTQPPTYDVGLFERVIYSDVADNVTENMTINITVENYSVIVFACVGGVALIIIALVLFRILRKRKVSNLSINVGNRLK